MERGRRKPGVGRFSKARVNYTGRGRNMKKVSKRGAYKKNVKNQMTLRRAPIVETKQRVHSDIATLNGFPVTSPTTPATAGDLQPANFQSIIPTDAFTFLPLKSFYRNTHGFDEWNCIGNSIYSKFLNAKVQVRFPHNEKIYLPVPTAEGKPPGTMYDVENTMITNPTKVYLICGWVTQNWNCPIEGETGGVPIVGSRPSRSEATPQQLQEYIIRQLKPYFDTSSDKLMFREKETSNLKIDKYVQFKPNLTGAISTQAVPTHESVTADDDTPHRYSMPAHGSIPDVQRNWSTKTNRKIHLTDGGQDTYGENLYPNHTWLPWMVIFNPSYDTQEDDWEVDTENPGRFKKVCALQYRYNDAHYFTDS